MKLTRAAPVLLLLCVTGLTFGHALRGTFIWDDVALISGNRFIKDLRYAGRSFTASFWSLREGEQLERASWANVYYRPLVTLSFMVDYQLWGGRPAGYHLTNLVLHLAVTLLFYLVCGWLMAWRATGSALARAQAHSPPAAHRWVALCAALLFAVHPSRAEAVTWISGRSEVLAALFLLAALALFQRALTARRRLLVWAWAAYVAAVLCKESALVLAALVPALDWFLVSGGDRRRFFRHAGWCHLPLAVISVAYLAARLILQAHALGPRPDASLASHLLLVASTLSRYAALLLDPYHPSIQVGAFEDLHASASRVVPAVALLLLFLLALWWALRRSRRDLAFALVALAIVVAPVSNVVPLSLHVLAAERFLYLPLAALAVLAAFALERLAWIRAGRLVGLVLVGVLASSWAVTTSRRSEDYADPLRFWTRERAVNPHNPVVLGNLAATLVARRRHRAAESMYLEAFRAWRRFGLELQLGALLPLIDVRLIRTSDLDRPFLERAARFIEDVEALPGRREPGSVALRLDGVDLVVGVSSTRSRRALERQRPALLAMLGSVLSRMGEDSRALSALERAHAADPERFETVMNLCLARLRAQRVEEARHLVARARALSPDDPAVERLGGVLEQAATRVEALRRLRTTDPAHATAPAQRLLAELMILTQARGRACEHLRRVVQATPDDRGARAMLALELASGGDLESARRELADARRRFGDEPGLRALEKSVREIAGGGNE
jgi:Flp pilus assembly protein TadD